MRTRPGVPWRECTASELLLISDAVPLSAFPWRYGAQLGHLPSHFQVLYPIRLEAMESVPGYRIGKRRYLDEHVEVRLGVREHDGLEVVLKSFLGRDRSETEWRARQELATLAKLAGPGVPQAIELTESEDAPVLVLQNTPELTLEQWVRDELPDLATVLEVSLQLVRILARAHASRLIVREICPAGITIEPTVPEVWLARFELARALGGVSTETTQQTLGGHMAELRFISPEATGRMGRGVDSRSDLYSLGTTLYFILTGRAPFEGDSLALIHSHIARTPAACTELRPEIPATLSRIVGKLLQKAPEDRYQTAYALERDLEEGLEQLQRTGSIQDDFPLGSFDAPYRPSFSRRIYGRDREIEIVHQAYSRALSGRPSVVTLAGAPGIGKSVLVNELRERLVETHGYLTSGKFDLYRRELPYAAIAQALNSLAQQILTESDVRLAEWREALRAALGTIAGAIVGLAPDIGLVIGDVPPVPFLGPSETRARLSLALQRLIRVLATVDHPLVLFLDDLQWADAASRELMRELLLENRNGALLVVAAYRDSDLEPGDPLRTLLGELREAGVWMQAVELEGIGEDAAAQMIADALGRTPDQTLPLARCVARKTGNSPLLIQQFIYHMYDLGLIRFEAPAGWAWDVEAIASADVPEGAVALLTEKISRLPEGAAAVLQLASCAGDEFDRETLLEFGVGAPEGLEPALFTLSDEGLIAPSQRGFRFVHDRIREAAQSLLASAERQQLHARAARLLLERTPSEQLISRAFEIADHLNVAGDALGAGEKMRALELNLLAGKRALVSGAAETAASYLRQARDLCSEALWEERPELCLDLFVQSVESALQICDLETAIGLLDIVEARPLERMAAATAAAKRIRAEALRRPADEVLPLVLEGLSRFGVHWPARPSRLRIWWLIRRTDWALRGSLGPSRKQSSKRDPDTSWLAAGMLMSAGGAVVSVASPPLLCFLVSYWLIRALRSGLNSPAMALATYASVRLAHGGSLSRTLRIAATSEEWCRLIPDSPLTPRAQYLLSAFIHSWQRSRRGVIEPLRVASERLFELGDVEYGFFALVWRCNFLATVGEPLDRVLEQQELLAERMRSSMAVPERLKVRALRLLTGGIPENVSLESEIEAIDAAIRACDASRMGAWGVWGMVLLVLGRYGDVVRVPDHQEATLSYALDLFFYRGVAAAALASSSRRSDTREHRRTLRQSLRRASLLARLNPEREHMLLGLRAEQARVSGHAKVALALYAQAADAATKIEYRHHAALLHERRADLLDEMRRNTEASSARIPAAALYEEWNARTKLELLHRSTGGLPTHSVVDRPTRR